MLFSSFFSSLFSSRRTSSQKFQPCTTTPHRGEQQWPKHLTEADFRAVLAAAVTVAIEEVAAVTAAAEVAAAEVAGEGKRTRTSGPRARSWGDWCKRYAFVIIRCFCRREGMCARGMDASLSRKCFATSRRRLRRALEVATPSSRAISVPFFFPHRLWSREGFLGLDISLDMSLRARPRERYVLTNVPSFRRGIHTG